MVMGMIWMVLVVTAVIAAALEGNLGALSPAVMEGASSAIRLALSLAGALCLWSALAKLMEKAGALRGLARVMRPVFRRLFPQASRDETAMGYLCANVSANLLGLGNAATPMGIQAAQRMKRGGTATDELCRLIVLNTASIQLIPANVAAVRSALGCATPFDILPAVWVTSLCSAGLGVTVAWVLGKVWRK